MNTLRKEIPAYVILPYANLNAITSPLGALGVYPDGKARRRERRLNEKLHRNSKR